ncbi:alpha/beta fold hydrolase [Sulfobacillus thermosulfidooxidans]|uniref:alpha/beta fold hydrolase n=1 Tax=Sulfobacillus thermosulfidooxidans TaxID=28034 RepID=UPI0006B5C710|nr:alpha/beta hydrolase [Sulfobacillus thermosulfidooxidans]
MQFVTGQGTIWYEVYGMGPSVVFLHSALSDHRQWTEQITLLSHHYQCITYDLPGHGLSDNVPGHDDPADTLMALLDYLQVDTATLVGSSLGGAISIHAAIHYPHRIRSIVLLGSGLFGYQPELHIPEPSIYKEYEAALATRDTEQLLNLAEAIWLIGLKGRKQDVSEDHRELFRLMYRDFLNNHPEGFASYLDIDDTHAVENLTMPVMVVVGDHDTAFCWAVSDYLEQTLAQIITVRIPNAAHFPNLSKPQEITELLLGFLKKIYP